MKQLKFNYSKSILDSIFKYEDMSQEGTVSFFEETVFLDIIQYYEKEDDPEKALLACGHALEQHPFSIDIYLSKAKLLCGLNLTDDALETLDRAELYAPAYFEVSLMRAEILSENGHFDLAFNLLESLKPDASTDNYALISVAEANIHLNRYDYNATFDALKMALACNPNCKEALEKMWLCTALSRRYKESLELHETLTDITPYSHWAWYNMAHALSYLCEYEQAIEAYELAFAIKEDFEFAYRDCGELYIQLGQYHKALDCYSEAIQFIEPDSDLLSKMGLCHEYLADFEMARNFYAKALKEDSYNEDVIFRMGESYAKQKLWKNAIVWYRKALQLEKRNEDYYAAIAAAYFYVKQYDKARNSYLRAIEIAPDDSRFWIEYACFLMQVGEESEAMEVLDDAEEHACGTELLYCRLALLFQIGRRHEALYRLPEALEEDFDLHTMLFDYAPELKDDSDILAVIEKWSMMI